MAEGKAIGKGVWVSEGLTRWHFGSHLAPDPRNLEAPDLEFWILYLSQGTLQFKREIILETFQMRKNGLVMGRWGPCD